MTNFKKFLTESELKLDPKMRVGDKLRLNVNAKDVVEMKITSVTESRVTVNEAASSTLSYGDLHAEVQNVMQSLAEEYKGHVKASSSVPSAPDTSKFKATVGGMIQYAPGTVSHTGGFAREYQDFLKLGSGVDLSTKREMRGKFESAMQNVVEGFEASPGFKFNTADGYSVTYDEVAGSNWGGFGFRVNKAMNENKGVDPVAHHKQKEEEHNKLVHEYSERNYQARQAQALDAAGEYSLAMDAHRTAASDHADAAKAHSAGHPNAAKKSKQAEVSSTAASKKYPGNYSDEWGTKVNESADPSEHHYTKREHHSKIGQDHRDAAAKAKQAGNKEAAEFHGARANAHTSAANAHYSAGNAHGSGWRSAADKSKEAEARSAEADKLEAIKMNESDNNSANSSIAAKVQKLLDSGASVMSQAAGRVGRVLSVDGDFVYIRSVTGKKGATRFDTGDQVKLFKRQDGTYVIRNVGPGADEWGFGPAKGDKMVENADNELQDIVDSMPDDVKAFADGGDMSDALYQSLFEYYFNSGEMPYGTAKARDGDPMNWISDRFQRDLEGLNYGGSQLDELRQLSGIKKASSTVTVEEFKPIAESRGSVFAAILKNAGLKTVTESDLNNKTNEGWDDYGQKDTSEAAANAISRRIRMQHMDLIQQYGLDEVMDAIEDRASSLTDLEEIGGSDVSAWVNDIIRSLEMHAAYKKQNEKTDEARMQSFELDEGKILVHGDLYEMKLNNATRTWTVDVWTNKKI